MMLVRDGMHLLLLPEPSPKTNAGLPGMTDRRSTSGLSTGDQPRHGLKGWKSQQKVWVC